jgi:hypothetical protein
VGTARVRSREYRLRKSLGCAVEGAKVVVATLGQNPF